MIDIVLADDHPVVRRGLTQFFEEVDDLRVVAECEDGESALNEVRTVLEILQSTTSYFLCVFA